MEENIYQNIDLTNNNPLKSETKVELTFKQKLKTDHKIQLLVGLSTLTIILLTLSIVISIFRVPEIRDDIGSNLPTLIPIPTIINQVNILPSSYQSQFDIIENQIKYNPEILPPYIDVNLGN